MTDLELKTKVIALAKGCGVELKCAADLAEWFMCDIKFVAVEDQPAADMMNEILKQRLKQIWEAK